LELVKEQRDAATKAQFEMANLLTSQREKYEDAITKLCDELAEAKVKLTQLSSEQIAPGAVEAAVAEAVQKARQGIEAAHMSQLKELEDTWNGLLQPLIHQQRLLTFLPSHRGSGIDGKATRRRRAKSSICHQCP